MKKKFFIGLNLALILFLTGKVYATNMDLQVPDEVKMGETVTLKLTVNQIDQKNGINILQGKLEYDKDIFEKVENKDFEVKDNWSIVYNDQDTDAEGKFIILSLTNGIKQDQEIGSVNLKVKDNIESTNTTVKISEISTVENEKIIKIQDSEKNLKVNGKFNLKFFFINLFTKIFGR